MTARQGSIVNKNVHRSRPNLALIPGTDDPKKILCHPKEMDSYTTARGELSNSNTSAGPYNLASVVGKDRGTTAFCGSFSTDRSYNRW